MKIIKDNKCIEIELVINDKYAFVDEIKNKVVYLNVRKKYDKDEVDRFIDRHFEHWYLMINDKEYKKFYGKKVVHYLGKPYFAKIKKSDREEVVIEKDTITLYYKKNTTTKPTTIYKRYLKRAVEETIVKLFYEIQNDFKDIVIPKIIVKGLKGERCFGYNEGNIICVERDLGRYDEKYIKSVIYHELCHCYIRDHSEAFYKLLDKKMEDGTKINKEVETMVFIDEF